MGYYIYKYKHQHNNNNFTVPVNKAASVNVWVAPINTIPSSYNFSHVTLVCSNSSGVLSLSITLPK